MDSTQWNRYLSLQSELGASSSVDDMNWGREAALNRILESQSSGSDSPPDVETVVRSEGRRERHRTRLRHLHLIPSPDDTDHEELAAVREQLHRVRESVSDEEWALLSGRAGDEYPSGARRTRILRIRKKVASTIR